MPAGYREVMAWGMLCWVVPLERHPETYNGQPLCYVSLASQKTSISLYLMAVYGDAALERWFRSQWAKTGKRLDMGKSCVRFRSLDDVPLGLIGATVARVPLERFVARYKEVQGSPRAARRRR